MQTDKRELFGVEFSSVTSGEVLCDMKDVILKKSKKTYSLVPVDSVVLSQKDEKLKRVYNSFDYVLADGMPIVIASKILGKPILQRVSGLSLFPEIIDLCLSNNFSVFFLGSDSETINKVVKKISARGELSIHEYPIRHPGYPKTFDKQTNDKLINLANKFKPDVLVVVFGSPQQDVWIYENSKNLQARVIIGVGAAFDFYAGKFRRAPEWMQNIGLEWLFRLLQEPGRLWRRYLVRDIVFPLLVLKDAAKNIISKLR